VNKPGIGRPLRRLFPSTLEAPEINLV
jgi:hypothetical protein